MMTNRRATINSQNCSFETCSSNDRSAKHGISPAKRLVESLAD
jgi:hypothetical protein